MRPLEQLNDDFRDLLVLLANEGAQFIIVGAYAVAFHGAPRATGDLDVLVHATPENAPRVWAALCQFGAPVAAAGLTKKELEAPGVSFRMGQPPRCIDLLTEVSGITFEQAWPRRARAEVQGREVYVIGREDLIANKRAAGRLKDLADIEALGAEPSPPA